ncbi:hypothetical protein CEXT_713591 [Caerostris extrusa]|uniref:Uncharacterized protein n=1 Tax=Caerostris extrusa TaxID=172846 RepID=A0AAV4N3U4_CAEEX|nr:hypothetical protein CEXT_713591 [Caerostris extrusa]
MLVVFHSKKVTERIAVYISKKHIQDLPNTIHCSKNDSIQQVSIQCVDTCWDRYIEFIHERNTEITAKDTLRTSLLHFETRTYEKIVYGHIAVKGFYVQ